MRIRGGNRLVPTDGGGGSSRGATGRAEPSIYRETYAATSTEHRHIRTHGGHYRGAPTDMHPGTSRCSRHHCEQRARRDLRRPLRVTVEWRQGHCEGEDQLGPARPITHQCWLGFGGEGGCLV